MSKNVLAVSITVLGVAGLICTFAISSSRSSTDPVTISLSDEVLEQVTGATAPFMWCVPYPGCQGPDQVCPSTIESGTEIGGSCGQIKEFVHPRHCQEEMTSDYDTPCSGNETPQETHCNRIYRCIVAINNNKVYCQKGPQIGNSFFQNVVECTQ